MPKINADGAKTKRTVCGSVWKGPERDGVTYSLLCRFLSCRERFRLRVVEGLVPRDRFVPARDFGNFWHAAEEALKDGGLDPVRQINACAADMSRRYQMQRDEIDLAAQTCRLMFPIYLDRLRELAADGSDGERRTLMSEVSFDVPYRLPSGRMVRLRGKWDRAELVKGLRIGGEWLPAYDGVWLTDHKTKGQVAEDRIGRQLRFDFQTMIYLTALWNHPESGKLGWSTTRNRDRGLPPIVGVRYNVIRKPQHRQGKAESRADFLGRLAGVVRDDPAHFFHRWDVVVTAEDVARFRRETLDPILEQLCDWWEWVGANGDVYGRKRMMIQGVDHKLEMPNAIHWRAPFGVYDPLAHDQETEYDGFLESGSLVGLERTDDLFPELKP